VSRRLIAIAAGATGLACMARAGTVRAQPPTAAVSAPPTAASAQPANPDPPPGSAAPTDRNTPANPDAPANPAAPADPGAQATTEAAPTTAAQPATSTAATAQDGATSSASEDEVGDQGISAQIGLAGGGRVTAGGVRVAGHYLYQLAERDWFDGAASFTFGSGRAACFRDRMDQRVCSHGLADGVAVEVSGSIRRLFAPQGAFRPFARAGLGIGLVQFSDDDVFGFTIALHGAGGLRVKVAPSVAIVAEADLTLGFGSFDRSVGTEPQIGFAVTAGAEFRLR
jgi:hypothetical protein